MTPKETACFFAICLLASPCLAAAQNNAASPTLDDLIPQRATEEPEAWAREGAEQGVAAEDAADQAKTPFETLQIPMPNLRELEPVAPPDVEAALPDEGEELFAEIDELDMPPASELRWVEIDDDLALAFPASNEVFPDLGEFIERFKRLRQAERIGEDPEDVALRAARIRKDRDLLARQLRAYGYYDARVSRSIEPSDDSQAADDISAARFVILPGERYSFGLIDLGSLASAPDFTSLRAVFAIKSGDPLLADRIISRRNALENTLGETGYPFSQFAPPELLIDHSRAQGDLSLKVEPGGKYTFGEVTSNLPDFLSGEHLARIARFRPGDIYQSSLEFDLRRAILATGLVSSVNINREVVAEPAAGQPGELRMGVELEKGRLRTIAGAIGYGTEDGVKIEASWEHRNLFPSEGALKVRGILGTREQLVGVGFKRNNFLGRDQILTLDAYASNIKTEAVDAKTIGLRGAFERYSNLLFQKPLSWQLGAELLLSDERNRVIGGVPRLRQEYLIGSVFGRVALDSSDSLLEPEHGFRASLFIAPEISRSSGHGVVYARAQADASFYLPAGDSVTLATRGRIGTIQGAQTFEVAPSRRIYSGGGSSVRGYGFQAVGPRNDFGEPTGGRSLVEFSAEARINTGLFDDALQIVPFFDLGTVSLDAVPDFRFVNYGVGLGVRYKTGFGPIRVDVGVPLNRNPLFDSPVAVYVSLGQAF